MSDNLFQSIVGAMPASAIAAAFRAQSDDLIATMFESLPVRSQVLILTGVITAAAAGADGAAEPKPRATRKPATEKPAKAERKAASPRGSNADNDATDAAVLGALSVGQAGRAAIVEATGLPDEDVRKAILRLSRNERIVSNGLRGLGAAYTVAHVRDAAE